MNFSKHNILTIAPFTKRLGFAVFSDAEILYFAVKTFKPQRSAMSVKAEISQSVKNLTEEFKPKLILVKTLNQWQVKSKNTAFVFSQVRREAEARKVPVREISLEQIKRELCSGGKPAKAILFKMLSAAYPEIKQFVSFQNLSQAEYYNSLLSAVAIGHYWQKKTSKSKPPFS